VIRSVPAPSALSGPYPAYPTPITGCRWVLRGTRPPFRPAKNALTKNVRTGGAGRQKWGRSFKVNLDKLENMF
jgi:hypothetical protein